jgi:hypothetical protein
MSEPHHVPQAGETIQAPRPSWGPAFLALGAIGAVAGIYANGFVFSAFVWSYIGIVIMLFAFRAIIRTSVRSYFSLPRRQHPGTSPLPVEQIYLESRPSGTRPQG